MLQQSRAKPGNPASICIYNALLYLQITTFDFVISNKAKQIFTVIVMMTTHVRSTINLRHNIS